MKQQGVVLITTLIFLAVLTLLVLAATENNLLVITMSRHFRDKNIAMIITDSALHAAVASLQDQMVQLPKMGAVVSQDIALQGVDDCQREIYAIHLAVDYHGAKSQLHAIYKKGRMPINKACEDESAASLVVG